MADVVLPICASHGAWDAERAMVCPTCFVNMQQEIVKLRLALEAKDATLKSMKPLDLSDLYAERRQIQTRIAENEGKLAALQDESLRDAWAAELRAAGWVVTPPISGD